MRIESKYSKITAGEETLLTVTVPDDEYGDMLLKNPNGVRSDVLNTGAYIAQKRVDIQEYLNQHLSNEQLEDVKLLAAAIAKNNKLISACTDDACGYRDIQMRLAGGHRLSPGMEREIDKIRQTIEPATSDEITDCIDLALSQLGYCSNSQYEYDKSRCGHDSWTIERIPVTGRDRETILRKLGKK